MRRGGGGGLTWAGAVQEVGGDGVSDHGVEFSEGVALGGDAAACGVVPSGDITAGVRAGFDFESEGVYAGDGRAKERAFKNSVRTGGGGSTCQRETACQESGDV